MTQKEYEDYQASVAAFFEREGLDNLSNGSIDHNYDNPCTCEDHGHDCNGDYEAEPYFSWRPCDCCGSTLGGDREDCIGYNPTTKKIQGDYSVCVDCIYYNEYGQLDDMTMMDMEPSVEDGVPTADGENETFEDRWFASKMPDETP